MTSQLNSTSNAGKPDEGLRQYLVEEFVEDYQDGRLTRRDALKRIAGVLGSLVMAESLLAACAPPAQPAPTLQPTTPPTVPPTRPSSPTTAPTPTATTAPSAQFPGQGVTLLGYLARPKGNGPFPAVLVCHENRGLTEHIKDVTRRVAKAGYVGLAVDLLSRQGGLDKITDAAQVPGLLANAPAAQSVQDFRDGLLYLQAQTYVRKDRIGMTGFCFGGGITWRCATQIPELKAAVPFYGPNPALEDVPNIRAAVLAIYGELDTRIDAGIPAIEAAMQQNNKVYELHMYPGANHAFNNDTNAARYNKEAADLAWGRTTAFLNRCLS